jgi:hypothetical protein
MQQGLPPNRTTLPPNPNATIFGNSTSMMTKRDNVLNPPYAINNAAGDLSNKTAPVSRKSQLRTIRKLTLFLTSGHRNTCERPHRIQHA